MLRADTGPRQIALRKIAPCDQYTRNLHAARYESPGLGAHCLLVWAHMPARAVPHGIASLAMLTVLDPALVVVQPGASIAARCTLKFPGIDSILSLRRICWGPRSPARGPTILFLFS